MNRPTDLSPARMPIIGIACNLREQDQFRLHSVGDKYAVAVTEVLRAVPVLLPALGDRMHLDSLLGVLNGVILTGGAANIEPHHYGQEPAPGEDIRDPGRDLLSFGLVRSCIERGIPLLGICRGIQEMNVALGGTLHQRLHNVIGRMDHRRPRHKPWEEALAARQRIHLTPGGMLARLAGAEQAIVNSLHGQGIDRLADALEVEALADDGTIEAVRVRDAKAFALGVQWHAEIGVTEDPFYQAIFKAFGRSVAEQAGCLASRAEPLAVSVG